MNGIEEIMNMIFEKKGRPSNMRKTLITLLYKKDDMNVWCGNYKGIKFACV